MNSVAAARRKPRLVSVDANFGTQLGDAMQGAMQRAEGPLGSLVQLNAVIVMQDDAAEKGAAQAIRARWEFGRVLLARREGAKQLPPGVLDEVAVVCNEKRPELGARMKLAELYPSDEELSHAVRKFPSWHQMRNRGLRMPGTPRSTSTGAVIKATRALAKVRNIWRELSLEEQQRLRADIESLWAEGK